MQEHNPYSPLKSNLAISQTQHSHKKTIQEALASDYDFSVGAVMQND